MAEPEPATDAAPGEGEEKPKPAPKPRGRPKDEHAPPKPKDAKAQITGEARRKAREADPEKAKDLKAMAEIAAAAWESTPQAEKDRLTEEYEKELAIWKPKWEAYKETPEYKDFVDRKADYMDIKRKKILIRKHVRGKIEVGKTLRVGSKFTHMFAEDSPDNYDLKAGHLGTVTEVDVGEEKSAKVDWQELGVKLFLKKYFGKVEDPEVPKRPKSGYMIHAAEVRDITKDEVIAAGGDPLKDVGTKIAEKWNALSEAQKAQYSAKAEEQKESFSKAFEEYRKTDKYKNFENSKVNLDSTQKLKKLQRTKLGDIMKSAPSAKNLWRKEVSDEILKEEKKSGQPFDRAAFHKKLNERWTALTDEEKAPYNEKAAAMKAAAEKKKKDFKTSKTYIGFLEERQKVKIRQNRLVNLRDMPKKPKSVFALFAQEHKSEVPSGKGEGKGTSALKEKFEQAPEEEKKRLQEKQDEMMEKYKQELEEYKAGDTYKKFETTEQKVKKEFMNEAMKVMTLKFLNAAPEQPPKTAAQVYIAEKRKANSSPDDEPKSKEARKEEGKKYLDEYKKLDMDMKKEFESKMKELQAEWKAKTKEFCDQELWKEYLSEARRLHVPVKSLLSNKNQAIKRLKNGMRVIAIPEKPEGMPTKPANAFRLFIREKRQEATEGFDLEAAKKTWDEMDAEAKKKYEDEAAENYSRFLEAMKEFRQSDEGKEYNRSVARAQKNKKITVAKFTYLKDMPKKPPNAFRIFNDKKGKEIKKENPDVKGFEIFKVVKEKWKSLTEEEKQPFLDEAQRLQTKYEEDLAAFKQSENYQKYEKAVKPKSKAKGKAKAKASSGPKVPEGMPQKPPSARQVFQKENAGKGMDLAALHKAYSELPEEDRKEREAKAKEAEDEYKKALDEFYQTAAGKRYKRETANVAKRQKLNSAKSKYLKDAPKKNPDAITLWHHDNKELVAKENPDLKGLKIVHAVKKMWLALSDEEKAPYLEKEAEAKKEYQEKLKEFQSSAEYKKFKAVEKSATGKGRGSASAAAPAVPAGMPKKPPTAQVIFKNETKAGKDASQKWLDLGAEGQKEWTQKYKELMNAYEKELKEFKTSAEGKAYYKALNAHEKKKREEKTKERILGNQADLPPKPKKPASAYFIFVSEKSKEGVKDKKEVGKLWSELDAEAKKVLDAKAAEAKEAYEKELKEYQNHPLIKKFEKAIGGAKKSSSGKDKKKSKDAKGKTAAGKGKAKAKSGAGKGKAKAKAKKDDDSSDSDAMGSDSDKDSSSSSSSSSSDSDSS
mmetsp:Transcript_28063/g.60928  ORF Transcript_28063/g.60928 Transcript_28063/m.60928 type:complete len:1274 (-) Transcript_28063:360-4181(-)